MRESPRAGRGRPTSGENPRGRCSAYQNSTRTRSGKLSRAKVYAGDQGALSAIEYCNCNI